MTYEERSRRQQVIGIVNMVYDICEKYGEQPTSAGIVIAVIQWMDDGITPSELLVRAAKMEKELIDKDEAERIS